MFRTSLLVLFSFLIVQNAVSQPATYPLYEAVYGSQYINPDSVRVDTATGSPTRGHLFATGYFQIIFDYNIIHLDSVSSDSILTVGLDAIDTTYSATDSALYAIQSMYGTITLRKRYPQIGDTSKSTSNEFWMSFSDFVDVDSAMKHLRTVPLTQVYFSRPVPTSVVPNDLGIVPGASSMSVFGAGWWRNDFHQLGWQWPIYKIHCPMAWEITMGRTSAPFVYILDGEPASPSEGWNGLASNPDMSANWVQINAATSIKGVPSLPEMGGHGMCCMSQAVAAANNGYPMVGVIPNGKAIGIYSSGNDGTYFSANYRNINVGGANYGTLEATQTYADVIYVANGFPSDWDYMIEHGTVVLFAAGNAMNIFSSTGLSSDNIGYPQTDNLYYTGGILNANNSNYPADNTPAHDIPVITVGPTMDGIDEVDICPPTTSSSVERGPERFLDWWTWPAGQEKFDQTSDPTSRASLKAAAFMDILAPGQEILDALSETTTAGYHIESGTSISVPEVAGVVGLMKSVNRWLGVQIDGGKPVQGSDVQTMAHTILTFTADKIADVNRNTIIPGSGSPGTPMAQGYPALSSDPAYTNGILDPRYANGSTLTPWHYDYYTPVTDPTFTAKDVVQMSDGITRNLNRSWAQRNGFGRVNAYRAVANTIPCIGNYSYDHESGILDLPIVAGNCQNENSKYLMHLGAWKDSTELTLVAGGNVIPNQSPAWPHYNQGLTKIYGTSGNPTVLEVPTGCILAIDGLLEGDGTSNNKITSAGTTGKILITGYLQDVEVTGDTVKADDLIIYSDPTKTGRVSQITVNAGDTSEIYGIVQLQGKGNFVVNGGGLCIQPGGEIEMEGNNNFEILSGGHVIMKASSSIVSPSKRVIVDNGATLEIAGLLPVNILCMLDVKSGGMVTIDNGANLQVDSFLVESNGTLTCQPGGRLTLNKQVVDYCYGNFLFSGTSTSRCTLTGGVSTCGTVDQIAEVWIKGRTDSLLLPGQTSIDMMYSDDSDVGVVVADAVKFPFIHDHFSINSTFNNHSNGSTNPAYIMDILSIQNSTSVYPTYVPITVPFVEVIGCHFFDEEGAYPESQMPAYEHNNNGLWMLNVKNAQIDSSSFYNISLGVESNNCPSVFYETDTFGFYPDGVAGPVLGAIMDNGSGVTYCNNIIAHCSAGAVQMIGVPLGTFHDNLFEYDTDYCLTAQMASTADLRNNTFNTYAGPPGWVNYGVWSAGNGSMINMTDLGSVEYGRNILDPGAPIGNASYDLAIGTNHAKFPNLVGGDIRVGCGLNKFGENSQLHIANLDPSTYLIAVQYNEWDNPPSGYMVRYLISQVLPSGIPLNASATVSPDCDPVTDLYPVCSIVSSIRVSNDSWPTLLPTDTTFKVAFRAASGLLLSDTNDVVTRRYAAQDEMWAASLMDSTATYLPMALNDFKTVTHSLTAPPEIKSDIWQLEGHLYEMLGDLDSAVFAFDTVITNYHQYSDSVYAQWGIQRDTIPHDTVTGISDSLMMAYDLRVRADIISMMDTVSSDTGGGAGKMADGHPGLVSDTSGLDVTVHPNPANSITQICVAELPGGIPASVDVVNETGEVVATLYNTTPDAELGLCLSLDCSKLPSGTYYAHVSNAIMGRAVKLSVSH